MFEGLTWLPDRALLGDLVFQIEEARQKPDAVPGSPGEKDGNGEGPGCFRFYKNRQLVEQFDRFWSRTAFRPRRMLEIGIWDGGSTAFWFEHLRPERLVAVDLLDREDSAYFKSYVEARSLAGRIVTHWRTDQADAAALRDIVERDLGGELDLVIDDGAHLERPTRAAFEALFALLPPGGYYIIEDWAWEHWPEFQDPGHVWAGEEGLAGLVDDLAAATGSSRTLIRSLALYEGFVAVERGEGAVEPGRFRLADHIRRRPWRAGAWARSGSGAGATAAMAATSATSGACAGRAEEEVKAIAFYLPQFHPIPENDRWWGRGFTEWSRVARARPWFSGHYQPHLPERLGFYDLRLPETLKRQAELARQHGVHGFCYYYYSFGTKRLLERPLDDMLASGEPDFPFCLCWANENWTRRWDGSDRHLLIEQRYGPELDIALIESLLPFFRDPRYLRVGGAPVLVVYRPTAIPEPLEAIARWQRIARENGMPGLHLVAALTFGLQDPTPLGFDAAVEFPPHGDGVSPILHQIEGQDPTFAGNVFDFAAVVHQRIRQPPPSYRLYRTAMAGWDNTARLGRRAFIFHHATPALYELWLRNLVTAARLGHPDHRLVFINAWNEWSEGAHLEPDQRFGTGYLEATRRAMGP